MTDPIKVMVVDDHPVWRDGVRADLERDAVATVVAEASDGGEAIERAREAMPDVVVMDLNLPTVRGSEATRQIVEESPHIRVLILSASGEEADVLEAVKAGARGYLLKSAPPRSPMRCAASTTASRCSRRRSPGSCSTSSGASPPASRPASRA